MWPMSSSLLLKLLNVLGTASTAMV